MDEQGFVQLASRTFWPELEDGKVPTDKFLKASQVILTFFDSLGKLYLPLKQDVQGNINKLTAKYSEDTEKYKYIQHLVKHEADNRQTFATESLLWLKRGLHFIYILLQSLVRDFENNDQSESILPILQRSYDLSLRSYHNWALHTLYNVLSRAAPSRSNLLMTLGLTDSSKLTQAELIAHLKVYVIGLKVNLQSIFDLYNELNLDESTLTV